MEPGTTSPAVVPAPLLRVRGVSVRFGGIRALDDVSFDVARGSITGLIGPNGAGKTTLFNCLSRLCHCNAGEIEFDGQALLRMPVHGMAALGIGRTFQNLALFARMSVRDNLLVGGHSCTRSGWLANALRLPWVRREEDELQAHVDRILRLLELHAVAAQPVSWLPFGSAKRVELGRALVSRPRLLLLDEPAGGLNHGEVEALLQLLRRLRAELQLTLLLVEHHMSMVMRVSDHVVALDFGRKIADGSPADVQRHPDLIRAYLGTAAEPA